MERFPSPNNDRNYNPLDKTKVSENLDQKLHKNLVQRVLRSGRRSRDEFIKTPELKDICGEIISFVHEFAHMYGSKRNKVPLKYIHFVDTYSDKDLNEEQAAFEGISSDGGIEIKIETGKPIALKKVHVLIHELVHIYSFSEASVVNFGANKQIRNVSSRSGLAVTIPDIYSYSDCREYFRGLNEAITETLALIIFEKVLDSTDTSENLKAIFSTLKHQSFHEQGFRVGFQDTEHGKVIQSSGYPYHRMVFNEMIQEIIERNPSQYKNIDDVKKIFFEAYFTGNFQVIAKIIEKTFGKSTLKKLAQADEFSPEVFAKAVGMSIDSGN